MTSLLTPTCEPMLAHKMPVDFVPTDGRWVAEEKYDGHRMCVVVADGRLRAFSRNGLTRPLPTPMVAALATLPDGTYDGELISRVKQKSYGVTELVGANSLCLVIFDVMQLLGRDTTHLTWDERRSLLEEMFGDRDTRYVALSWARPVLDRKAIDEMAATVWQRGGEGLILKHRLSPYLAGKRARTWLKIKQLHTALLTVVGFVAGLLGPHAVVLLEDADGNQVSVKTLNTKERIRIGRAPEAFIGRKLWIEFQERTPDGGYRHPMWDRWEDE